ncbi:copper ABC transporter permease [Halopenitus sp. POP-27]|uniref:copper ABC transporter permease n=1 Tax=Halopenitus sp. POP-27 TaxID=2994425 RepID=UPI0024694FA3|nr:copper ABC transporter permease [Halopenitus sp. POP-27]
MTASRSRVFGAVLRRELATVVRTPGYWLTVFGLLVVLGGVLAVGGGGETGFIPTIVDLLMPTEVIVPVVAVVLGYRALLADAEELAMIRTYPVSMATYVCGVFVARVAALVGSMVPFALIGGVVWLTASPDTTIYATHTGVDSPLLFVRFLVLVVLLGIPYLSMSMVAGVVASSRRGAIAIVALLLVGGVLGGDLAVVGSLGGDAGSGSLPTRVAIPPNGAFRGLVFEHVVGVALPPDSGFVSSRAAIGSLIGWTVVGVGSAVCTLTVGGAVGDRLERLRVRIADARDR